MSDTKPVGGISNAEKSIELAALSTYPHRLHHIADFAKSGYKGGPDGQPADLDTANVISSQLDDGTDRHTVAIDLDVPARLVPSSTAGHSHLYIDVPMTWEQYAAILDALADAGIVQDGYAGASKARGYTTLRLPWVSKAAA